MRPCTGLVALLAMAAAGRAQEGLPAAYTKIFENSAVVVIRAYYGPHEKIPVHAHSAYPTVYVYLSDSGPVRFTHVEEHPFSLVRPPVRMGSFRVSPGRIEKHEVENLGDIPSEYLRVELKRIPLHSIEEFRGNAAFDLTQTSETTAYSSPALSVLRIIVAGAGPETLSSPPPALLVAFTPATVSAGSAAPVHLKHGDVYWLDGSASARIDKTPEGPAHLLAIRLGR